MRPGRVVITGVGTVSPFGYGVEPLMAGIREGRSAVRFMPGWGEYKGLRSLVGAPAELRGEKEIPRKKRRSMSPMSIFAVQAAEQALSDAGLDVSRLDPGRAGCILGSTMGSAISLNEFFEIVLPEKKVYDVPSMLFFKCMAHSAAMNVAQYFGLSGYVMATSAACASGLQAIGTGCHLLRLGLQDVVLSGGAEELHPSVTGIFDLLYATSAGYNDSPLRTPRPFDSERDGLVCGEGGGIVILETLEHAVRRGAHVYAEIIGYNTCGSGSHISHSEKDSMARCMELALDEAGLRPGEIDYINAHATATVQGDREEAAAIAGLFGETAPVSSLKGYFGHTLGASGAIELIASLMMMKDGIAYPGLNLQNVAPDCGGINHLGAPLERNLEHIMKNSFAFGGVNASMVCRKI
jgi:3-oxoacyl-[acyl-carrier-protein] synthase II